MHNPLLAEQRLPAFSQILPEHAEPAIDAVLADNRRRLETLLQQSKQRLSSWDTLIIPLDEMEDRLHKTWSPIQHLNAVKNSDAWRQAHDRCLEKITDYNSELGQNTELYEAIKQLAEQNAGGLVPAQHKALDDALLGFRLSGVALPEDKKARFKIIQQELSNLGSRFEQNVLDATLAWSQHITDPEALKGLPETALAMARQQAKEEDKEGWVLSLQMPCYIAVMTYADDRDLRKTLYTAYSTRASDQGPHAGQFDNTDIIEKIMRLRQEEAQLLGYGNFAELSLATKMAKQPAKVMEFLNDLADRAYPKAMEEFAELNAFAAAEPGGEPLQPWDVAYYSEKLRVQRYAVSQEEIKPWFPADRVIAGLFDIVKRLYGLNIRRNQSVEVWHPDVSFYDIYDDDNQLRGQFYLDLYARPRKRGGAWMDACINRFKRIGDVQIPVAHLVCNLSPPIDGKPALFTHDDVQTLFHEFGHGLHHMLTRVDYPAIAGIHGVEWDAVELPSQFMENWCWESEAINVISGHYRTGEPLPEVKIEKLRAAKNFHAAMQMVRQLEFSLFDFRLHAEYDPEKGARCREILQQVRERVAVVKPPAFNRFENSFSHIFAGGYAAGYYSYKWAEVLSADAFSKFEEAGIFDAATGKRFMECILEQGGSEHALELFKKFRGREPTIEPLLRHSGLTA